MASIRSRPGHRSTRMRRVVAHPRNGIDLEQVLNARLCLSGYTHLAKAWPVLPGPPRRDSWPDLSDHAASNEHLAAWPGPTPLTEINLFQGPKDFGEQRFLDLGRLDDHRTATGCLAQSVVLEKLAPALGHRQPGFVQLRLDNAVWLLNVEGPAPIARGIRHEHGVAVHGRDLIRGKHTLRRYQRLCPPRRQMEPITQLMRQPDGPIRLGPSRGRRRPIPPTQEI